MKVGKTLLGASFTLSLTAFALPCWASAPLSSSDHASTPAASHAVAGQQVAWGDNDEEHHEREERAERAHQRHREHEEHEQNLNGGDDEEHGGTRNFIREHVPGTDAHQEHEEREGEENHNMMRHDND